MSMIEISLESIQQTLQGVGLLANFRKNSKDEEQKEQIIVPLTPDAQGRERMLLLSIVRPPFSSSEEAPLQDLDYNIQFLQFFVPIPISIQPEKMNDVSRLLNMLNTVSELPGFFIAEKDRIPLFRYNMTCTKNKVDSDLLVMTVGLILYILENYSDIIDKIATGKKKLSELIPE